MSLLRKYDCPAASTRNCWCNSWRGIQTAVSIHDVLQYVWTSAGVSPIYDRIIHQNQIILLLKFNLSEYYTLEHIIAQHTSTFYNLQDTHTLEHMKHIQEHTVQHVVGYSNMNKHSFRFFSWRWYSSATVVHPRGLRCGRMKSPAHKKEKQIDNKVRKF